MGEKTDLKEKVQFRILKLTRLSVILVDRAITQLVRGLRAQEKGLTALSCYKATQGSARSGWVHYKAGCG